MKKVLTYDIIDIVKSKLLKGERTMKKTIELEELLKILQEIEEEGRQEASWATYERDEQHGWGMMDAVTRIRNEVDKND